MQSRQPISCVRQKCCNLAKSTLCFFWTLATIKSHGHVILPGSSEYWYMQPFTTKEAAVSNNKHDAFSALDGENWALAQSIRLHKPDFLLSPPCRSLHSLVPVATAQSALKYLLGTLAGSPTRQRAVASKLHPWLLAHLGSTCVSQEHSQEGCGKLPGSWGQCSCGRWASASCLLRRDSCKRTRPRAAGDLNICRAQEVHSHCWFHWSTWGEEWAAEVSCCIAEVMSAFSKDPITASTDLSLDVLWPCPQRQGATSEPKLPHTLSLWSFPLPFRSAAASICQGHSAAAFCHSLSLLAIWVSSYLEMSKTPKLEASHSACASHSRQSGKEYNLVCSFHDASSMRLGDRMLLCLLSQQPTANFWFQAFIIVFHSSKVARLEEPTPTLTLVWRLHLCIRFWFTVTHHPFKVKPNHSRNAQAWCPPLYSLCNTGLQVSRKKSSLGKKGRNVSKHEPFISVFT